MYVPTGSEGYFGIGRSTSTFVAVVGVQSGKVVAGSTPTSLVTIESVPKKTAYPAGWVDIWGMIINYFDSSSRMLVFVDGTNVISANVSVPNLDHYTGALIQTAKGNVY